MGMIEEVGAYLTATTGQGTLGTDVFLHTLPETTRLTVGLIEGSGAPATFTMGSTPPAFTRGMLDIFVRSTAGAGGYTNPTNARQRAQRVWNRLAAVTNQSLSGSTYLRIEPNNEVHLIDRDERGRVTFGASFTVYRRGTTSVT